MIKLTQTSAQANFHIGDESGYKFDIHASLDDEWGWSAAVTISSFGMKTQDAAIEALQPAVKKFLELLASPSPKGEE